jgi:hypothetical protein
MSESSQNKLAGDQLWKKNSTHQLLFIILKSLNKKDNHSLKIPILI